jgi:hypothetical protein
MTDAIRFKLIAFAAIALGFAMTGPAAAIDCKNGYQLVQGSYLATPYCQDALLAAVARDYGMGATAAEIRANPNYKRRICRFIGQDIRVQENCQTINPNGRGRSF